MVAEQDQIERNRPRNDRPIRSGLPGGLDGTGDQTELAELGFHEKTNPRRLNNSESMLDSRAIARDLLTRAKFSGEELNAVEPLLVEAKKNHKLEDQMTRFRSNP